MRMLLVALLGGIMFVGLGCKSNDNDMDHMDHHGSMSAAHDDCPHCPGVQTARADGTCPLCGAKVK
jgi:hypothetical protein